MRVYMNATTPTSTAKIATKRPVRLRIFATQPS